MRRFFIVLFFLASVGSLVPMSNAKSGVAPSIPIELLPITPPTVESSTINGSEVLDALTGGVALSLRQPYDFSPADLQQGIADLFKLPGWLESQVSQTVFTKISVQQRKLGLILFVAGFTGFLALLGFLTRRMGQILIRIADPFHQKAKEDFGSLLVDSLLTFARKNLFIPSALLLVWGVTWLIHLPAPLSVSILAVLVALTIYMPVHHLLVIVYNPKGDGVRLVNLKTPSARRLYWWLGISAGFFVFPLLAVFLLNYHGYNPRVVDFLRFANRVLLTISAAWALGFRKTLFAWEKPPREGLPLFFYQLAYRLYYPVVIGLLLLFGAAAGGYRIFSNFILGRVGLVAAVIIGAFAIRKILQDLIRNWIRSLARDEVASFHSGEEKIVENLRPTLTAIVHWGVPMVALWMLGSVLHLSWESFGLGGFHHFLVTPFVRAADTEISIASIVWAVMVFALFYMSGKVVRGLLTDFLFPLLKVDEGMRYALSTSLNYVVTLLGLISAFGAIGINWATLTVFIGAMGVGLGFGLQKLANNFVSGLTLLFEQPVRRGDFLEIGNKQGVVHKIGSRGTVIATRDNTFLIVPNAEIMENIITNWSYQDLKTRVRIPFSVAYGTDLQKVDKMVLEIADSIPTILKKPAPKVSLNKFGGSALEFELQVWVSDPTVSVSDAVNRALDARFRAEEIAMSSPQSMS